MKRKPNQCCQFIAPEANLAIVLFTDNIDDSFLSLIVESKDFGISNQEKCFYALRFEIARLRHLRTAAHCFVLIQNF